MAWLESVRALKSAQIDEMLETFHEIGNAKWRRRITCAIWRKIAELSVGTHFVFLSSAVAWTYYTPLGQVKSQRPFCKPPDRCGEAT